MGDSINHPTHYEQSHPGMECIDLTDGLSFGLGNMVKLDATEKWVDLMAGRHIASAAWRRRRMAALDGSAA